jgi:ketosteroid isomerase-like protein
MRRRWHLAAFVAAATVVSCQAKRAEFTAGDEAAIRAISDSALAYIHRAEWSKWAALYADDAIFHPPNGHPIKGRAGIEAFGKAFPPVDSMHVFDLRISGSGDLAYLASGFVGKFKTGAVDTAKQLVVFRRVGSDWKAVALSFSSDLPPAGAVQAGAPARK